MKPVKIFTYQSDTFKLVAKLFKSKIVIEHHSDTVIVLAEYTLTKAIGSPYKFLSLEKDTEIFMNIVKFDKPKKMSLKAKKYWEFWKTIDLEKISDVFYELENQVVVRVFKYGVCFGYFIDDNFEAFTEQNLANFFFTGPKHYALPLDIRMRVKQDIYNALNSKMLKLSDGFVLFDYRQLNDFHEQASYRNKRVSISIALGVVTVQRWEYNLSNKDDDLFNVAIDDEIAEKYSPDTNLFSVENLWYYPLEVVPTELVGIIRRVKGILKKAIIRQTPTEPQQHSPDGRAET